MEPEQQPLNEVAFVQARELRKDIRLEMKIKNNALHKAIFAKFPSVAVLCQTHPDLSSQESSISALLSFKISPFKKNGQYRNVCLTLEQILVVPAEDLFPKKLYQQVVGTPTTAVVEVSSFTALPAAAQKEILLLPAPTVEGLSQLELEELRERIGEVLNTLSPREGEIIKLRFGIPDGRTHTLDELAHIFRVNPERIRQIEARALRKLRSPLRSRKLRSFVDEP